MRIPYFGFLKGENSNISTLIHPPDQPKILNGCTNTWKVGALTKDPGYVIVGSQIQDNKSITGMFNFIQDASTEKMLCTVDDATSDDTQLFYSTGGAWTEVTAAETQWANYAGIDVEMESMLGYCFIVGYGDTDGYLPVGTLNGTTFGYIGDGSEVNISDGSSTANVTMPKGKYVKRYRDRLYVANCKPAATEESFRVYYSDVPTAGTIAWNRTTNFLDVDYSDQITGMEANWDKLVIFTEKRTYMYDQSEWRKTWDYGCSNHRTIKNSGPYMIFANQDGVWISTSGRPKNIAGEIMDFIKAANMRNAFAELVDEEYHLHLGTVTVDGITYTNCVKTLSIPLTAWRTREYTDTPTVFATYNDSGTEYLWFGTDDGQVMKKGKYTDATLLKSDNGVDFASNFELAPTHFNDIGQIKRLNQIIGYANKGLGLKLKARAVDSSHRKLTDYMTLGELTEYINHFHVDMEDAVLLQIAGGENGSNEYWEFLGYELDVDLYAQIE